MDETVSSPAIDTVYFPGTPGDVFWSASFVSDSPSDVWIVDFYDGLTYHDGFGVTSYYRACCVC